MDIEVSEPTMRKAVPLQLEGDVKPALAPADDKNAPKVKELTQAELEERRKNVLKSMGYDEELAKDEPKVGDPKPKDDKPQAAAPAEEPPPETEEQRKKREEDDALVAQADREAKEDERITRVATATAAAVKDAIKPEEKPAATPAPEETLEPEDAADLEAVEFLAGTNPEKLPKGITAESFRKYYKDLYTYRDQWVKDNPGKEFNPADEEHSEFIQKNEPDIPVQLLDEARKEVEFEKRFRQRVQPQLDAMELRDKLKQAEPVVNQAIYDTIDEVSKLVSPKIHEVISKGGKLDLSEATVKEADKVDPIARRVMQKVFAEELTPAITVIEQSAAMNGRFPWDYRNAHHARVLDEILECDRIMSEAPASKRIVNGKEFITIADLTQKRDAITSGRSSQADKNAAFAELGKKYWTLTEKDWKSTIVQKHAQKIIQEVNYLEEMAAISNGKTATPRTLGAKLPPKSTTQPPAPVRQKPNAPRVPGSADVIAPPGSAVSKNLSSGEKAAQIHFS